MNYTFQPLDVSSVQFIALIGFGILAGIINTLAGSGSLITLPLLMFIGGLPAPIANATNRVGIVIQGLVGFWGWQKAGKVRWQGSGLALFPALLGAVAGAFLAADMSETTMKGFIAALLFVMFFLLAAKPERWIAAAQPYQAPRPVLVGVYFALGVYGGFLQAGLGLVFLAALVLIGGYDLSRANGIKLLVVTLLNLPAFFIFLVKGQIHLQLGLTMAAAQAAGAWLAVRFVARSPKAEVWMYRMLLLVVAISAVKMLYDLGSAYWPG